MWLQISTPMAGNWKIMRITFFLESNQHLNRIKNGKVKNGEGMCISVMI